MLVPTLKIVAGHALQKLLTSIPSMRKLKRFFRKPSWGLMLVAMVTVSLIQLFFSSRQINAHRALNDRLVIASIAAQDSMRMVAAYKDSLDSERQAWTKLQTPNEDSLRQAVTQELEEQWREERLKLVSTIQFLYTAGQKEETTPGTAVDTTIVPETVAVQDTIPEVLTFEINESRPAVGVEVGLKVYPRDRRLDYDLTTRFKPQDIRVYTLDKPVQDGILMKEIWVDVPGTVQRLTTYSIPTQEYFRDMQKQPKWNLEALAGGESLLGNVYATAGLDLRFRKTDRLSFVVHGRYHPFVNNYSFSALTAYRIL